MKNMKVNHFKQAQTLKNFVIQTLALVATLL